MTLPAGRVPLLSSGFDEVLETVHSFHDGFLGFAHFDYLGPMAFIDSMWFGPELSYNPKPVLGGVFWFDIADWSEVKHLASQSNRQIYRVVIQREVRSIEFQLQDKPYERLEFKFGPDASFQFIASDSLHDVILERRKSHLMFDLQFRLQTVSDFSRPAPATTAAAPWLRKPSRSAA